MDVVVTIKVNTPVTTTSMSGEYVCFSMGRSHNIVHSCKMK